MSHQPSSVIRTHLSEVFLSSDRVYKLLRPVKTSFVDFTDRATRLEAAAQEFELNRRISPDVYLGLADIEEHGELADRMIVMRRLPADRQLDRLVDDPAFPDHLREVARLAAAFHASQPPLSGADAEVAGAEALQRNWTDNFEVLKPLVGAVIPAEEYRRAQELVDGYIAGRQVLFQERIDDGWVRDGHGDLRCEHVFCIEGAPRLIDCLAFRDDFRVADVLNDVAFLAMDLHRLAGPAAARSFVDYYDEFSNEHHPSSLAHHYVAYRASVRAKVAAIRFGQGEREAVDEIVMDHRLALQHLELGQPRLILVGGGAGVGKSTVAAGVADRLAASWLRADEVRKNMAGIPVDQHAFSDYQAGLYDPEFSEQVYRELLREAELLLTRGESVVLDATWSQAGRRELAHELGRRSASSVTELMCQAPASVARQRVAKRMASVYNPSDADVEVVDRINAEFAPWPAATIVDTNQPIADSVEAAYRGVLGGPENARHPDTMRVDEATLTDETIGFFLSRVSTTTFAAQISIERTEKEDR